MSEEGVCRRAPATMGLFIHNMCIKNGEILKKANFVLVLLPHFLEAPAGLLNLWLNIELFFPFLILACIVPGTDRSIGALALLFLFYCLFMSGGP